MKRTTHLTIWVDRAVFILVRPDGRIPLGPNSRNPWPRFPRAHRCVRAELGRRGQPANGAGHAACFGIFNYLPPLRVTLLELPFLHLLLHNRHRVSEKLTFLPLCPTWRHTSALQRVFDVANKWEKTVLPLPLSTKAQRQAPGVKRM
jgi:hypothetical protein